MSQRVCPVWMGYLLANPFRRFFQNPEKILSPYLKPGMTVLEVGPGMGFFTLPMARMVSPGGRIVAVDVQDGMLKRLRRKASASGVSETLELRLCAPNSLGIADLAGKIDFILLFAVVHEVADQRTLFAQLGDAANPGCHMLFVEPRGHVTEPAFNESLRLADAFGFHLLHRPKIGQSHSAVLQL